MPEAGSQVVRAASVTCFSHCLQHGVITARRQKWFKVDDTVSRLLCQCFFVYWNRMTLWKSTDSLGRTLQFNVVWFLQIILIGTVNNGNSFYFFHVMSYVTDYMKKSRSILTVTVYFPTDQLLTLFVFAPLYSIHVLGLLDGDNIKMWTLPRSSDNPRS